MFYPSIYNGVTAYIKKAERVKKLLEVEKLCYLLCKKIQFDLAQFDEYKPIPVEFLVNQIQSMELNDFEKQTLVEIVSSGNNWYNLNSLD